MCCCLNYCFSCLYSTASEHFVKAIGELHLNKVFPSVDIVSHAVDHAKSRHATAFSDSGSVHYVGCVEYSAVPQTQSYFKSHGIAYHVSHTSARDDLLCVYLFPSEAEVHELETTDTVEFTVLEPVPELVKLDDSVHHLQYDYFHLPTARVETAVSETHPIMQSVLSGEKVTLSVMLRPKTPEHVQKSLTQKWFQQGIQVARNVAQAQARYDKSIASHLFWTSCDHTSIPTTSPEKQPANATAKFKFKFDGSSGRSRRVTSMNRESNSFPHRDQRVVTSIGKGGRRFRQLNTADQELFDSRHSAWKQWGATLQKLQTADRMAEVCGHHHVEVRHHRDNIILSLPNELLGRPDTPSSSSPSSSADTDTEPLSDFNKGDTAEVGEETFSRRETAGACMAHLISAITADPLVTRVALSRPMQTMNNLARQVTQLGALGSEPFTALKVDGSGVVVGISDTGIDETSCYFRDKSHGTVPRSSVSHPVTDLKYRKVVQYITYSGSSGDYYSGHGSHVAGTVAGYCEYERDNAAHNAYHGMAPAAKIAFFDIGVNDARQDLMIPDDIARDIFTTARAAGAHIHSNSWGGGYLYDSFTLTTDEFLYKNSDFLAIFAAGNSGGSGSYTVCSPALSKNCLAVACSNTGHNGANIDHISSFSSHGPALDGRIKPDITAPGSPLFSVLARSEGSSGTSCETTQKSGTSMATPVVAGTAALVLQYFQDPKFWAKLCDPQYALCSGGAFTPSGVLMKALLLHSGKAVSGYDGNAHVVLSDPPDVYQGYGRVNLQSILPTVVHTDAPFTLFMDQNSLAELTEKTYAVEVTSTGQPLKVTLSWFDPPNEVFAAKYLLHDLDLVLEDPQGQVFYGNAQASDGTPALGSHRDELNNNEQVYITAPKKGTWTVRIQAKRLTEASHQDFSVVITAKGVVHPVAAVKPLSPALLEECHLTSGTPSSTPRMELEVAKFAKFTKTGWSAHDFYSIQSTDGADFSIAGKSTQHALEVDEVCIPGGCFSASLSIESANSKKGSQLSIPECGVYLSPMSPVQNFCVDPSGTYHSSAPEENIPVFSNDPCVSECEAEDHLLLPLYLGEYYEGAGWSGTYFSVQRLHGTTSPPGFVDSFEVNSAGSGTMDWGFELIKDHCLPLTDACYALQLSIPAALIINDMEYPILYFMDTFLTGAPRVNCPFEMNSTVTLAKFCVETGNTPGAAATTTVSFYEQTSSNPFEIGQSKTSWADFSQQISAQHTKKLGTCTGKASYSARAQTMNVYDTLTQSPSLSPTVNPTVGPTAQPSVEPSWTPSAAPSLQPSEVPTTPPTLLPSASPTLDPTISPSFAHTQPPSPAPTQLPTDWPSADPTVLPTALPSAVPTAHSHAITVNFTDPTTAPSLVPSAIPSFVSSTVPSAIPNVVPSAVPSTDPSAQPTKVLTDAPTVEETVAVTATPSVVPSASPSAIPSAVPSAASSTVSPSVVPTSTAGPTAVPSLVPTVAPTIVLSTAPTVTGTHSLKEESRAVYGNFSLSCLSECPGYPGLQSMVESHDVACMFLVDVYHLCSSYSVAYGMCNVPSCAADCTIEEWCYFGGGTVVSCPFMLWQGQTADAMAIADQCVVSVNATVMGLNDDDVSSNSVAGSTANLSPNAVAAIISKFLAFSVCLSY